MPQIQPDITIQAALLDAVAQPGAVTAMQQLEALYQEIPKQQVDFQLETLAQSIRHQERKLEQLNVAHLNFSDPLEAKIVGEFFATLFPEPMRAKLGIMELLMNSIEHGNLGITQEQKEQLLREGSWMAEITKRLQLPGNKEKRVHAYCYCDKNYVQLTVRDEGKGFDWRSHVTDYMTPYDMLSGRGIATAKHIAFDEMGYSERGNVVWAMQYRSEKQQNQ